MQKALIYITWGFPTSAIIRGYSVNLEDVKILTKKSRYCKHGEKEALYIRVNDASLNRMSSHTSFHAFGSIFYWTEFALQNQSILFWSDSVPLIKPVRMDIGKNSRHSISDFISCFKV